MSIFNQPSPLVVDPNASPTEQCLDEISAALRKHGFVLGIHPGHRDCFVLGKISDGVGMEAVAVAEIRQIAPTHATWRPVSGQKMVLIQ